MRLLTIFLIVGGLTRSQPANAQNIERAKELFQEASSLREAGMYAEAVSRLRQAITIKDTPGLEYHAGFCESKLGHYRLAIQYYERAAALLRDGASAPDVVTLLPPAQQAALEHVARLRIAVIRDTPSTRLRLDDEAEQPVPDGDLLVDPGKHRLVIAAPGFKPEERQITVAQAEHLKIDVRLSPLVKEVAPASATPSSTFPWKTVSIGLGLGVTAAGVSLGIVSAVRRHDAQGRISLYSGIANACNDSPSNCTVELTKARSDKDSAIRWETVGFVSAGVGAVASLAFWSLWPSSRAVSVAVDSRGSGKSATQITVITEF